MGLVGGLLIASPGAAAKRIDADSVVRAPQAHVSNLSYGQGPVLHSNRTHVIFWQPRGSGMSFEPGYQPLVERFLRDVAAASHRTTNVFGLTGQYRDYTHRPASYASQYDGAVLDTHRLPSNGCAEPPVTGPGWAVCLTDSQLQSEVEQVVRAQHLPIAHRNTYFLVLPRGFGSCMNSSPASGCALGGGLNGYCGYHQISANGFINYAVIPYNAVPGHCRDGKPRPNGSSADPAVSTISHELSEMITDPTGRGWADASGNEDGDLCIQNFGPAIGGSGQGSYNQVINGDHYYLQEEWSNATGACEQRAKPDRASFSVTHRSGRTLSLRGGGNDPEGSVVAWKWFFGDAGTARGRTVQHQYARGGSYPLTVRITDSWDNWTFYTREVTVSGARATRLARAAGATRVGPADTNSGGATSR